MLESVYVSLVVWHPATDSSKVTVQLQRASANWWWQINCWQYHDLYKNGMCLIVFRIWSIVLIRVVWVFVTLVWVFFSGTEARFIFETSVATPAVEWEWPECLEVPASVFASRQLCAARQSQLTYWRLSTQSYAWRTALRYYHEW